jgi:hypothetical protein
MTSVSLREQIIQELDKLTEAQQTQLLDIARRLQKSVLPPGTPGNVLIELTNLLEFAPGEVDAMMHAIEEGCEGVDWDGWQ